MRLMRTRLCSLLLCAVLTAGLLSAGPARAYADVPSSTAASPEPSFSLAYATYDTPEERAAAVNKLRYRFLGEMLTHIGCPYEKGRGHYSSAKMFDCSGLVAHAFISIGYSRYFSISDTRWNAGGFQAYDGHGLPSSDWKDFSWRGSSGLLENVKDGQTIYLLPDSSKNPVLAFTVRKSAKKSDYASDISNPAKWSDDFRGAVSQRGTILVKNHVDQTKWHITTVVGYYDEEWFLENGHDINPATASISSVKSIIRKDLVSEFSAYGLASSVLNKVHQGLAEGKPTSEKISGKSSNSSFNDIDREDDVYPAMWDLRQRRITSERKYSPIWQIDALNPRMGVSVNNSTLAATEDNSIAMVLEWEEYGACHMTAYDNASSFGGEDRPVAGGVYAIYDTSDSYEALAKLRPIAVTTADENGEIRFGGLPVNGVTHSEEYCVIELSPPDGCEPDRTVRMITVTRDGDAEIPEGGRVTSACLTGSFSVQLDRSDCLTEADIGSWGGASVGSYTLRGLTLRATGTPYTDSATFTCRILADGDIVHNGQTLYTSGEVVRTVCGSALGTVTADGLPLGDYTVVLGSIPTGWSRLSSVSTVTASLTAEHPAATRILSCDKCKLRLRFSVTDRENRPVSGGRYGLYCERDIYDVYGNTLLIAGGTPIAVGTAGADGIIRFAAPGDNRNAGPATVSAADDMFGLLPVGFVYYLAELDAPDGYLPYGGKIAVFTYSSPDWEKESVAEYRQTFGYDADPSSAEAADLTIDRSAMSRDAEMSATAGNPGCAATGGSAVYLVILLLLPAAATVFLFLRSRRMQVEER